MSNDNRKQVPVNSTKPFSCSKHEVNIYYPLGTYKEKACCECAQLQIDNTLNLLKGEVTEIQGKLIEKLVRLSQHQAQHFM